MFQRASWLIDQLPFAVGETSTLALDRRAQPELLDKTNALEIVTDKYPQCMLATGRVTKSVVELL